MEGVEGSKKAGERHWTGKEIRGEREEGGVAGRYSQIKKEKRRETLILGPSEAARCHVAMATSPRPRQRIVGRFFGRLSAG